MTADSPDLAKAWKLAEAANRLDGLTMKQAFEQFVIGDLEVERLGKKAIESQSISSQLFESGLDTWPYRNFWPVCYEELDLAAAAVSEAGFFEGSVLPTPTEEVRLAATALANRYAALIDLLRSGDVIAIGDPPDGGGDASSIRKVIWSSPDMFIDFNSNNLVRGQSAKKDLFRIGLELRKPAAPRTEAAAPSPEVPAETGNVQTSRKGPPPKITDEIGFRIADCLIQKADKPDGLDGLTQENLINLVIEHCRDNEGVEVQRTTVQKFLNEKLQKTMRKLAKR